MNNNLDFIALLLVTISSLLMGLSVYFAMSCLLQILFRFEITRSGDWQNDGSRLVKLRENSSLFRNLEPFQKGLASLLDRYFISLTTSNSLSKSLLRVVTLLASLVNAHPTRLTSSCRQLQTIAPWKASEVLATHLIVAVGIGLSIFVLCYQQVSLSNALLLSFLLGLGSLGALLYRFHRIADRRREAIRSFLPYAMDTLAMVVSAGGTFREGLKLTVENHPDQPISDIFNRLLVELSRGATATHVLQEAASSVNLAELDEMVRVMTRIQLHGSPGSEDFVRLAKQTRMSYLRFREESVGKAEAKMALPTMLVMGACMIIAAGPFILAILATQFFN